MGSQDRRSQPAEWERHRACWVALPWAEDLWLENLPEAQRSWAQLCRLIARGEQLEVLVPDARREDLARALLEGAAARFHRIPVGDIWLRDTAPIFVRGPSGEVHAHRFQFNGWGLKYVLEHDDRVSARVAEASGRPSRAFPWVLEGGAVEPDGEGTVLTTRQCLLNPNRGARSQAEVEAGLREALGAQKVLWVTEGLLNDHTDGHIDTIARFVAPGRVVCMAPAKDDPNAAVLERIASELSELVDARGRRLEVLRVPSPGEVTDETGRVMPASYVNFYIANQAVVVPTYGVPADEAAVRAIAALFPGRRTEGVPSRAILSGGGAFHCITQQEPAETAR